MSLCGSACRDKATIVVTAKRLAPDSNRTATLVFASVFFLVCTWASYSRWSNFEYRTFDLAYYVQALWQFIHGRFQVSVLNVPLLGNHVEPIVFLLAPLFVLFRHPMLLVVAQNAALATLGPLGYSIRGSLIPSAGIGYGSSPCSPARRTWPCCSLLIALFSV